MNCLNGHLTLAFIGIIILKVVLVFPRNIRIVYYIISLLKAGGL